ncbi:branched-chain amino acid transport system permease protein [Hydrogenophaga laconesensis]|uniref:Branched-chain amino acid transport system permease protein n=1 Tax=Hydrogenophaga laconesensis TaxID=1805971 RepID=A0ABU1VIZ4_9BURK|nr:branched-chain amino acid transport system permease protein [Hydrogenophaga laconesensis]
MVSSLNGLAYGLLLFMLSSGLTLTFSMMGILNFAHASFYMFGAYIAYALSSTIGFWPALLVAPLLVGLIGAAVERFGLRSLHRHGHIPELLLTYGLAYIMAELVQVVWGRTSLPNPVPPSLQGTLFTVFSTQFPVFKGFMMLIAVLMLLGVYLMLSRSRVGLIIQAALTQPKMVEALGHDVPRIFMMVFGGGCALAGLAGVLGGIAFVTEPSMAHLLGGVMFVVVVIGGLGSLVGALVASLMIGLLQTFAIGLDVSLLDALNVLGLRLDDGFFARPVLGVTLAQAAPMLPYLLLVLILVVRPRGLLGTREA